MSFKYNVQLCEQVDIDDLIEKWNRAPAIVNHLYQCLTNGEYALINFIVNEGLKDIRGQEPSIDDPADDDPFPTPVPDPEPEPEPTERMFFALYGSLQETGETELRFYDREMVKLPKVGDTYYGLTVSNIYDAENLTNPELNNSRFDEIKSSCQNIRTVDNITDLVDLHKYFADFRAVKSILLNNLHGVENIINLAHLCQNNVSLTTFYWNSSLELTNCVTTEGMFENCSALETLSFALPYANGIENMDNMFYNCSSLPKLIFTNWNVDKVTTHIDFNKNADNIVPPLFKDDKIVIVGEEAINYDGQEKAINKENITVTVNNIRVTDFNIDHYINSAGEVVTPKNVDTYAAIIKRNNKIIGEASLIIKPIPLTASYVNEIISVNSTPRGEVRVEGFINGENADNALGYSAPIAEFGAVDFSKAGENLVPVCGGLATNYTFVYIPGVLTINDPNSPLLFAIYDNSDESLNMYNRSLDTPIAIGDTFDSHSVSIIYNASNLLDEGLNITRFKNIKDKCSIVEFKDNMPAELIDLSYYFAGFSKLIRIFMEKWTNTQNIITLEGMFKGDSALNRVDWNSNNDYTSCISTKSMFEDCTKLYYFNFAITTNSNITNMDRMFYNGTTVGGFDLSNWNVNKVISHVDFATNATGIIAEPNWKI